jgi:hypothetical protein
MFVAGLPSMRDSLTNPVHVYEGDDALITCVVRDIGENTIMWKKEDRERHSTRVLTAVDKRVTADKRFAVLHDSCKNNIKVFLRHLSNQATKRTQFSYKNDRGRDSKPKDKSRTNRFPTYRKIEFFSDAETNLLNL